MTYITSDFLYTAPMEVMRRKSVQLVVLDVDGVLTDGESAPFDLELFQQLAALNERAKLGEPVPAVTVCTGRPQAYVEAVLQALHASVPGVFEGGAGLYVPEGPDLSPSGYRGPVGHADCAAHIGRGSGSGSKHLPSTR